MVRILKNLIAFADVLDIHMYSVYWGQTITKRGEGLKENIWS